ncbi:ribokinase [Paucilactobacillus suebicus]|uniref:Ribokinase n=1 Tax=Paucilactobacillus suebicus DSM 5007 = KCTC 3549 TaxID=1423807 RepID=A0A0R1W6I4_9LACO|nr:ribokinase [Paucilactobacillus suebicus]KRM13055.1 ribokinase [Paucilactobacillus suebicus DSM 5007 = KCTC 3549]
MGNKVVVLGSLNVDTIFKIPRMPQPGETLHLDEKSSSAGGKGANQAVAAVRNGAQTSFIGKVGDDQQGTMMKAILAKEGININAIATEDQDGTGSAAILLDRSGQNSILVYGGANQKIDQTEIRSSQNLIKSADFLVTQFETPQLSSIEAFKIAKDAGVTTILNPAPASTIEHKLLQYTDLIVPNETESASLTGIEVTNQSSMIASAKAFKTLGVNNVIITVGNRGAYYSTPAGHHFMSAYRVVATDTTGAGDTFIGALCSRLQPNLVNLPDAVDYAQRASSIAVQTLGAIPSIPTESQVLDAIKNN